MYESKPIVVRDLLDPDSYNAILTYMDEVVPLLRMDDDLKLTDEFVRFGRKWTNDLPPFRELHNQLQPMASELMGQEMKPSYHCLSLYEKGGSCPLHLDRPQCRFTVDYLIRQEQTEPWPIRISDPLSDKELKAVEVRHAKDRETRDTIIASHTWETCELQPNDAVCYSGTHAWHYRPEPSQGKVDLVFFHFVPKGFRGPLQ